jgi:plasmid stabilization system protein ParE
MHLVTIEHEAKDDIAAAMVYYEGEREGLGQEFLDELKTLMERLSENPRQYQVYRRAIRKAVMRRFPFLVFYRFDDEHAYVVAVTDGRQSKRKIARAAARKPQR